VRGWFEQNINPSPTPVSLLLGFGLLVPLAIVGSVRFARSKPVIVFLLTWIVTVTVIIYIPGLSIQRRLLSGIHIPIAVLATFGLSYLLDQVIFRSWRTATTVLMLVFLAATNGKTLQATLREARHPEQSDYPIYITRAESEAIDWLRQHSSINDVVLASFWNGNTISGLIARPVTFAHGNQTLVSWDRAKDWETFSAADTTMQQRQEIINRLQIRWLFWTTGDQQQTAYHPADDLLWRQVFQRSGVSVFQLQTN
jgi:asparagine N-glycosylation enzyme membrane subunit Stt3